MLTVNPASVKITKIRNGFLVEFEEAVAVNGATPEDVKAMVEKDLETVAHAGMLRVEPKTHDKGDKPVYRWQKTQLYCRNIKEISRALPEALMAVIIKESEEGAVLRFGNVSGVAPKPLIGVRREG